MKEAESKQTNKQSYRESTTTSPPLIRAGFFLMGQNAAITEWRRGNTTLPVVFITLTQVPAILLVAAMHSTSRRKQQHHCAM